MFFHVENVALFWRCHQRTIDLEMDHRVEKKGSLGHLLLKLIKMEEAHWSVCVLPIAQGWRKGQIKTVLLRPAEYVLENVLE